MNQRTPPERSAPPTDLSARMRVPLLSLAVAVTAALLTLFVFTPRFVCWRGLIIGQQIPFPECHRAVSALIQLQDPWAEIENESNKVIAWRLLFPLLWYYLYLPVWCYLIMPAVGCLASLWLAAHLTYRRLANWPQTWLATAFFAALPWFFVSTGWLTYFDSWVILGLVSVGFVRSRAALGLACLLTPWIDERFVFGLPIALFVRAIALGYLERKEWRDLARDLAIAVATSVPYPAIRALVWLRGDAESTAYVQQHWEAVQNVPVSRLLEGLWSGFRAGWLMIWAAVYFAAQRVGWKWGGAFAVLVIGSSLGALIIAADMSRTLAIVTPVLLLGIWLMCEAKVPDLRYALPAVVAANFLLPAQHVVWPFTAPIRYLYAQIDTYNDPPRELTPSHYLQMGATMRQQGNRAGAAWAYSVATRLDDTYAPAYAAQAALQLDAGDAASATVNLETALRLDPDFADALYMRAALRRAQNNIPAARADLKKALNVAPLDWPMRPQAQRFYDELSAPPSPVPKSPE